MMERSNTIRILIVDDHPVVREGLAALLDGREMMCVIAQASNGQEAINCYREQRPDITLLDMRMPDGDGLDTLAKIRKEFPHAYVIMLSAFDAQDEIYQAIRLGARSFLLKDTHITELLQIISRVADGQLCLPAYVTSQIADRIRQPELTAREKEVLECMVQGLSNQEIANQLFIAEGTVKVHVSSVINKLHVEDRTQAVIAALKRGLVHLVS